MKAGQQDVKRKIGRILIAVLLVITVAWMATVHWVLTTWAHLTLEQLIYQLKAPMEGTSTDIVLQGVIQIGLPLVLAILASVILLRKVSGKKVYMVLTGAAVLCDVAVCGIVWENLDVADYIKTQGTPSTFIEDNYANPAAVKLTFPKKKRNLIYIYLESMEMTYADKANGGGFEQNVIPELTRLAEKNESFAGNSGVLNGGYCMPGTTWTMAGMFAQSSGLPLKISISGNSMSTQTTFFPSITTLGDILAREGYRQILMLGSDAEFGGRKLYFQQHGNYEMQDYLYAKEAGLIPNDYFVWWGYEDEKLFANAKKNLTELAASGEPFNLTMLTADTHFEDGYVCRLCKNEFRDNQYANAIACSSRQVAEFVEWIQQQDFYEDTAIVISGDHLTMDSDFCDDVSSHYDRKVYTTFVNAAEQPEIQTTRIYTTLDNFPTTLAAMGVKIEGNRLGLGTNLFSDTPTLAEQYGVKELRQEIGRKSEFMDTLGEIDKRRAYVQEETVDGPTADVEVTALENERIAIEIGALGEADIKELFVQLSNEKGEKVQSVEAELQSDRTWHAEADVSMYERSYGKMEVCAKTKKGKEYAVYKFNGNLKLACKTDFEQYLKNLQTLNQDEYTVILAISDEGTSAFTDAMQEQLNALGFSEKLAGEYRTSYLAIRNRGKISEQIGYEELENNGTMPNGKSYHAVSCGYGIGSGTVVEIDGRDYALNARGFNAVVYDAVDGCVVSSTSFDTCATPGAQISLEKEKKSTYYIDVAEISGLKNGIEQMQLLIWDANTAKKPVVYDLERVDEYAYAGEVKLKKVNTEDFWMEFYAVDSDGGKTRVAKLHGAIEELTN